MREKVSISYRGAHYELGRRDDFWGSDAFYGIWAVDAPRSQPSEKWPVTPQGWYSAWARFIGIEDQGAIIAMEGRTSPVAKPNPPVASVDKPWSDVMTRKRSLTAIGLLGFGVLLGVIGLFPDYLAGSSLSQQASDLLPHVCYLAVWALSAILIVQGGSRLRVGALLGLGTSIVTFGLFFADAGTPIAGGAHLMGAGLILSILGWSACAAGSVVAIRLRGADSPGRPQPHETGTLIALVLAAIGAAVTFAPSWDSFTLHSAAGASSSLTAGNAFSNPGAVIAGDLATMILLVAVVVVAALWRPLVLGAALLAGAVIPMAAQAISALVQLGGPISPQQFGITPAEVTRAGITIGSGVTPVFWVFCAFVAVLVVGIVRMLIPTRPAPYSSPGYGDGLYGNTSYHNAMTS